MKYSVICALALCLMPARCLGQATTTSVSINGTMLNENLKATIKSFANTVNAFALKVLVQLLLQAEEQISQPPLNAPKANCNNTSVSINQIPHLGNVVFSTTSLVVLSMLYLGSAGTTRDEIGVFINPEKLKFDDFHSTFSDFLSGFSIPKNPQNTITLARRLLVDANKIDAKFVKDAENYYEASVEKCDFEKDAAKIAQETNSWVRKQSGGLIDNILKAEELNPLTRLVVLDAILFKGVWAQTFNKSLTKQEPFYITPQIVKNKTMMTVNGLFRCFYLLEDSFKLMGIEIPFVGLDASLYVLLPEKWEYQNLTAFVQNLTLDKLAQTMQKLPSYEMTLKLPKFITSQSVNFKPILQSMGLKGMFDPEKANFSPITTNLSQPLHVTEFKQKAVFDVNEEGVRSAAVTIATIEARTSREFSFIVNRPFIFYVVDNRISSIIFAGVIHDP